MARRASCEQIVWRAVRLLYRPLRANRSDLVFERPDVTLLDCPPPRRRDTRAFDARHVPLSLKNPGSSPVHSLQLGPRSKNC